MTISYNTYSLADDGAGQPADLARRLLLALHPATPVLAEVQQNIVRLDRHDLLDIDVVVASPVRLVRVHCDVRRPTVDATYTSVLTSKV